MSEEAKKKRGPKPKPPEEVRRNNFTFRIRDRMRAQLIEAAEISGRAMSEEAERRLEETFRFEGEFGEVAKLIGMAIKAIEARDGKKWSEDENVRISVRAAVGQIVDVVLGPAIDSDKVEAEIRQDMSEGNMLVGLKRPDHDSAARKIALLERELIGLRAAAAILDQRRTVTERKGGGTGE